MNQSLLNRDMLDLGRSRYHSRVQKARERGEESTTAHGKRLLTGTLAKFQTAVEEWLGGVDRRTAGTGHSAQAFIKALPVEQACFLAAKSILDSISMSRPYTSSCEMVGALLEDETRYRWLKKNEPGLWTKLERQVAKNSSYSHKRTVIVLAMNRAQLAFPAWAKADRIRVGMVLIELFSTSTGLVERQRVGSGRQQKQLLSPTETTSEWLRGYHEFAEVLEPVWLPTTEVPTPWQAPKGGAYAPEGFLPSVPLVKRANALQTQLLDQADMPEVYHALNLLQETPWQINTRVLDTMETLWESGVALGGMPAREDLDLPAKPPAFDDAVESLAALSAEWEAQGNTGRWEPADAEQAELHKTVRNWRARASKIYSFNASMRSQRVQTVKIMGLARRFAKETIYFPCQLDFRGRTYCLPYFLHPQGNDLARSLLKFAQGKPVESHGVHWLQLYGANLWGLDKKPVAERLSWVAANTDMIQAVATDPLACREWMHADDPWMFLAWCFEWSGYLAEGPSFVATLPVCIDATNNGLQILSLLTRDPVGAKATNVVPNGLDTPSDIYGEVAQRVIEDFQAQGDNTTSAFWLDFGITRSTTKRPVMVLPYGGTFHSALDYVRQWFDEQAKDRAFELPEHLPYTQTTCHLATAVWESIGKVVVKAREAMEWLQKVSRVVIEAGHPLVWTTPTGFPVVQGYKELKSSRIETLLNGSVRVQSRINLETPKLDKRRNANGVSPNFVHSLDAACLHKTMHLTSKFGVRHFCMIHDSYGVLPSEIDVLAASLRKVFMEVFTIDLLTDLRNQLETRYPDLAGLLPEVPTPGSLDVSQVGESEFIFS